MKTRSTGNAPLRSPRVLSAVTYAVLATLTGAGLAFLLGAAYLHDSPTGSIFLNHLGVVFLISGVLGLIEKRFGEASLINHIRQLFDLRRAVVESGLRDIACGDDRAYPGYRDLIAASRTLTVVVNYGSKWISNYAGALQDRFKNPGMETDFVLLDPKAKFVGLLAEKQGDRLEDVQFKINHACDNLKHIHARAGGLGRLRVMCMPFFPTHAIYLGSEYGIITLYPAASNVQEVPVFSFINTGDEDSLFGFCERDVAMLKQASTCVFEAGGPSNEGRASDIALDRAKTEQLT